MEEMAGLSSIPSSQVQERVLERLCGQPFGGRNCHKKKLHNKTREATSPLPNLSIKTKYHA
jgi:hypothetical protein